ncbi:PREDICTED: uncharacterized protein LOC18607171 isoform X1 [Theobroma cacao]|uniref:Uncharacterized protein LOC18607171 isoform X1 n=1 Tax=Theobroma cacao TaxID=3641 RepID=A0AB32VX73_THECC|nr:PREDICTED: uncharacterized protein LOC18607171 isoform X1 [Theobroma cacao]
MDEKRRAWPRGMSKPLRRRRGRLPGSKHAASSSQVPSRKGPKGEEFRHKDLQHYHFLNWRVLEEQLCSLLGIDGPPVIGSIYPEHEMLSTRNDVEADLSNQEIQVANGDDNVFEQDQANRGNNNHDGLSLMDVVEANADSENYLEHEILWTRNDAVANLGGQEIEVTTSDDFEFEQAQANSESNNHDGSSLMDVVEANADSENYLEHGILWNRNDVEANLGGQENEVTTSDDFELEQDQANRDSYNHDGLSLMDVVEANADSENYSEHEILWNSNDVEANLGGQENEVTTGDHFEFERNRDSNNHDGSSLMDVLAWVFPITNFTLELPSAVLDQLSSINKPHYALILMLISFIALMACIGELICKGKKGRVTWQWRDRVPRFSGKPFDNPWEIIGFACVCLQCVVTAINYSFVSRHVDGPIKTSALPILFAFGLLCSKYFEKPDRDRGNPDGDSAINLVGVRVEP